MIQSTVLSAQSHTGNVPVKFNHVAISVTDLSESEQFYRDVVGLKQIPEPFGVGRHAWFDLSPGELHVISSSDERRERQRNNHLCLSVKDMESFIRHITSHGVVYYDVQGNEGQVQARPDGVQQIYFTDPDGYWIEINDAY